MKYDLTLLIIGILAVVASFFTGYLCTGSCIPCSGWDLLNPFCQTAWLACVSQQVGCFNAANTIGLFLLYGGLVLIGLWVVKDVLLKRGK